MTQLNSTFLNGRLHPNSRAELAAVTLLAKKYTKDDSAWREVLRALGVLR